MRKILAGLLVLLNLGTYAQQNTQNIDGDTAKAALAGYNRISIKSGKLWFRGNTGTKKEVISANNTYTNPSWLISIPSSKISDWSTAWDTRLLAKTTDNLGQGSTNKYYSDAQVATYGNAHYALKTNNLSDLSNASLARSNLGLAIGTNVQAYNANLTTYAGITPTTVGGNIVGLANPGAIRFLRLNADNTVSALDASSFLTAIGAGSGGGTVLSASVVSANGFAGSVATATTTPAFTLSTTVTGLLKGNGTAISAATAGTDYLTPTGSAASLTSFPTFNQNTTGSAATVTGATQSSITSIPNLTTVGTITSGTWSGSFGAVSGANLTNLTAGNLSGTIPSGVLGNSTLYIGTTATVLNRASANQALTGISSVTLPGSTSGTVQIIPAATAGTGTVFTLPANTGTAITSGDAGTVTNTMLAGSIANAKLSNSAVTVGSTSISLGSSATTIAGLTSVTSTTFVGALTGNSTTATTLATTRAIYGNNFDGSAALTQIIASTYGGTGNGFTKFSGAASSEKTYTLPNANATILTDNAAVTLAQGGTGGTDAATARANLGAAALNITANRQTASYTLVLSDAAKLVESNVVSANNITVPPNSSVAFPVGTQIVLAQYGAGQATIVAGAGVTIRSSGAKLKLTAQYSGATLIKIATDEWYAFGDLTN